MPTLYRVVQQLADGYSIRRPFLRGLGWGPPEESADVEFIPIGTCMDDLGNAFSIQVRKEMECQQSKS